MRKLLPVILTSIVLVSCETTQKVPALYSWHNYENTTYQYSKRQTDELRDKVLAEYKVLVENQKGVRGVVPPGLYAEYGYLLCKVGEKEKGLEALKEEIKLYPESEQYISRIIKQLEK